MKIFIGQRNSCNLNYQREIIYGELHDNHEIVKDPSEADIIIFPDTCCTTEYHARFTIWYINEILKKKKDTAKTIVTGCITRHFKRKLDGYDIEEWLKKKVDYVIPQNNTNDILKIISDEYKDKENTFGALLESKDNIARLFISNGCRNNCSFCKVTYQDYPLKSIELPILKETIDFLDENGCKKLIIKGTNVSQYGLDLYNDYKLPEVIDYIEKKDNIEAIDFVGFAYKDAIKNDFAEAMRESSKIDEIGGSLESGSNRILKLIRKGFTSEEIIEFVNEIRKKYPRNLRLNVISGFPTETMEDVFISLEVLKRLDPKEIDLCRYTNSKIVDSNKYEQLTPEEIQEHTRIYEKVLRKRNVKTNIVGNGYKYN